LKTKVFNKQYWINRITKEIEENGEPIWYDADLIKKLDHFNILTIDLNRMALITLK
jgi:hypothetical protein